MRPPWFKLLLHNQNARRRFGLTLVFLLGATRNPPGQVIRDEEENITQFLALIRSMRDETPESHYIAIGECDRLRQPVANPTWSYGHPSAVYRPLRAAGSQRVSVAFQPQYFPHPARGIDSIREALWPLLAVPVVAGTFSFYGGRFHKFGQGDRAFIADALSLPDEDEI